jgi:hypothetical protein
LAARDFAFFMSSTIPTLLEKMKADRLILPLQCCLEHLSDARLHFAEWAQSNIRNVLTTVSQEIPNLLMQMKQMLLVEWVKMKSKTLRVGGYCFDLTDSQEMPIFSLPYSTQPQRSSIKRRMMEATETVDKKLAQWKFPESPLVSPLLIEVLVVQKVTADELRHIKLLSLSARLLTPGDLSSKTFCSHLYDTLLSSSNAVAVWGLQIINQMYVAVEENRFIFLRALLKKISRTGEPPHAFILLQTLVRFLELSLPIPCEPALLQKFPKLDRRRQLHPRKPLMPLMPRNPRQLLLPKRLLLRSWAVRVSQLSPSRRYRQVSLPPI